MRLQDALAGLPVPGASLVLLRGGQLAGSAHCGVLQAGHAAAVRAETVFEAASMSKPVFAYLVLQQVQRGRLDLDRPVMQYLPHERFKPPQAWQRLITARMLLTHRSGLPNWRPEVDEATHRLRIASKPGERFNYSGEGFAYLQRMLEQITGEPLQTLAERELFRPLGMTHSGFVLTPRLDALRARGHDAQGQALPPSHYTEANAAYTLFCSAEDYARFLTELLNTDRSATHSLSAPVLQAMLAHQTETEDRAPIARAGQASGMAVFWGLGWGINTTASQGDIAYHSGTNSSGFRSYSQFSPSRRSGLVVMSNGLAGNTLWQRIVAQPGDI